MKKLFSIIIMLFCSPIPLAIADDDNNWGIPLNSQVNKQRKEVSEFIWDAEMQTYIESEYGSSESSYYNNRDNADSYENSVGGDAFGNYGY